MLSLSLFPDPRPLSMNDIASFLFLLGLPRNRSIHVLAIRHVRRLHRPTTCTHTSHARNEAWRWSTRAQQKEKGKKTCKRSASKRTKRFAHGWNDTSKGDATVRPHQPRRTSTCKRSVSDVVHACCARAWTHLQARKRVPKSDGRWCRSRGTSRSCEEQNAPHASRPCRACAPFVTSCDERGTNATSRGRRRAWHPPQVRCYVRRSFVVVEKRWSCTSHTSSPGG
mmetsp:Transcript_1980/g.12540  ORF Transcript_1980/g.12540 Transcript_1980/m.12540 type:complete len:225 (+) Transcript_1980:2306-2980(+)